MGFKYQQSSGLALVLRWTARISGLALLVLALAFYLTQDVPPIRQRSPEEQLEVAAIGIMLGSYVVGWRWEALSGCVALTLILSICGLQLWTRQSLPAAVVFFFAIPGALFLASAIAHRRLRRSA